MVRTIRISDVAYQRLVILSQKDGISISKCASTCIMEGTPSDEQLNMLMKSQSLCEERIDAIEERIDKIIAVLKNRTTNSR